MKKKLFITTLLCALSLTLVTGCGTSDNGEVKKQSKSNVSSEELKNESDSNKKNEEVKTYSMKETFEKTVEENNLKITENSYDLDALKSKHCNEAILASNGEYTIEYFEFEDEESLKKEFDNQIEYQKSVSSKQDVINSGDNIYEATTVSTPDVAPKLEETAYNYVLFIKDKKSYISIYQTSKNNDKEEMIKIGKNVQSKLGM